jgi:hypothetical protein
MKKFILTILTIFALATVFSGCDKPQYRHPLHNK